MNHKLISVLFCLLFLVCASVPFVVAETGDSWDSGFGFDATPTPSAAPIWFSVFNNIYLGVVVAGMVPIVCVLCFILYAFKSGLDVDVRLVGLILVVAIIVVIGLAVAIQLAFSAQNAIPVG